MADISALWLMAVVGGPVVLAAALAWAWLRSARQDRRLDPHTPSDDPSQGMRQ
jgi:hypothetical protein